VWEGGIVGRRCESFTAGSCSCCVQMHMQVGQLDVHPPSKQIASMGLRRNSRALSCLTWPKPQNSHVLRKMKSTKRLWFIAAPEIQGECWTLESDWARYYSTDFRCGTDYPLGLIATPRSPDLHIPSISLVAEVASSCAKGASERQRWSKQSASWHFSELVQRPSMAACPVDSAGGWAMLWFGHWS